MANTAGLAKMTFTITEIYKRSVTSNSTGKEKALSKKKKKRIPEVPPVQTQHCSGTLFSVAQEWLALIVLKLQLNCGNLR